MNDYKPHYSIYLNHKTWVYTQEEHCYRDAFMAGYQQASTDIGTPVVVYKDNYNDCLYCNPHYPLSSIPSS